MIDYRKVILFLTGAGVVLTAVIVVFALQSSNSQSQESSLESFESKEVSEESIISSESSIVSTDNESSEETEQTAISRKEYEYKEYAYLEGLYFLPSSQYAHFKNLVDEYLESIGMTDITEITVIEDIESNDDINYTFWLKLSNGSIVRGLYNIRSGTYEFSIETDESIIDKYN